MTVTAPTPFGLAPVTDASKGVLVGPSDGSDAPAIAGFGPPQVAVAPVAAPVGAQPNLVYCTADKKLYIYDFTAVGWFASAAM